MNNIAQNIFSVKQIYNNPAIMASIVDEAGNILYISQSMQKLQSCKSNPQYNNITMKSMNNKVIQSQRSLKYIYTMQTRPTEFTFFICYKHPVYEKSNIKPVAILTTQEQLKVIDVDNYKSLENVNKFNHLEQNILLYLYLGLSHGEIYKSITNHFYKELQFKQYQFYCKRLLDAFDAASLKEINNNDTIIYCSSVLNKIIKDGFILMKAA